MPAPNLPGLGIEMKEKVNEANPYSNGGRLHLEMCQTVLDSNNQQTIDEIS